MITLDESELAKTNTYELTIDRKSKDKPSVSDPALLPSDTTIQLRPGDPTLTLRMVGLPSITPERTIGVLQQL